MGQDMAEGAETTEPDYVVVPAHPTVDGERHDVRFELPQSQTMISPIRASMSTGRRTSISMRYPHIESIPYFGQSGIGVAFPTGSVACRPT
jgi:hypothetical protein